MTEPHSQHPEAEGWIGQHIGNYRLIRLIGEGGMGLVFEAVNEAVGGRAAVKILRPQINLRPDLAARFFNEARAANAIQHPGIVRVFDSGYTPNQTAFLTMEYLEGESLSARLARTGKIPLEATLRIGRQLASALGASHRKGIVHRDLKPDNIMLVADPDLIGGERVKVLDFGIAKMTESMGASAYATETNLVMGTPAYMAPEQCRGAKLVTDRADVYSLGTILYQMLAGHTPFVAEGAGELLIMQVIAAIPPLDSVVAGVEPAAVSLIHAMLVKDPTARPSMDAVMGELQQIEKAGPSQPPLGQLPLSQPPLGQPPPDEQPLSQPPPNQLPPSQLPPNELLPSGLLPSDDSGPTRQFSAKQLLPYLEPDAPRPPVAVSPEPLSVPEPAPLTAPPISSAVDVVSAADPGVRALVPPKTSLLPFLGVGVVVMLLVLLAWKLSRPTPPSVAKQQVDGMKVVPTEVPTPPPTDPPTAPEDLAPPPAPTPVTPAAKLVDAHYTAARRLFEARRYPEAVKEAEKCGHDITFPCNVVRAKAACHTPNRAPVQAVLDYLKDSRRSDKDKAIQEVRAECQANGLEYAEKLFAEKQYLRAITVARGNKDFHRDRAWSVIGRAACAMDDRPTISQALMQLQPTTPRPEALQTLQSFCKSLGSRPSP